MKPRTKLQKQVVALSKSLPAITEKQTQWAYEHCFEDDAYLCKKTAWCLRCGNTFHHDGGEGKTICPHCGRTLKLKQSRKRKVDERWYYTILTTYKGFQVCRHFIVTKWARLGNTEIHYDIAEAVQNWINESGQEAIIARTTRANFYTYDCWNFYKPLELKDPIPKTSYNPNKYDINAQYIYPQRRVLPKIKRNGYTGRFKRISASELFKLLLTDRQAEELIKTGQYECLRFAYRRCRLPEYIMNAIHICNRNGYIIQDAQMYCDYIDLLRYFGKDIHNAHYVCPQNMKAEHDKLYKKKERIEEQKRLEEKLKEIEKNEMAYKREKGKYFGICFGNKDIMITVLQSVAEIAEEGKEMHHCVYASEYFKKSESLILSAKDKDGKRIETIEVNLRTFKVVQSRGVCNKNTPKHEEIIKLVQDNMNLIRKAKAAV